MSLPSSLTLRRFRSCLTVLAMAMGLAPIRPANAAELPQPDWLPTISGFGTAGVLKTDAAAVAFRRSGQAYGTKGSQINPEVDSDLGLQANQQLLPWLSAMAQAVAMRRDQRNINVEAEWAFLRVELSEDVTVRAGRLGMPTYALSDRRLVGYAQTTVRPPEEVYELDLFRHLDGVDVRRSTSTPVGDVELQGLAGKSKFQINQNRVPVENVLGFSVTWMPTVGVTVHAARVRGDVIRGSLVDRYTFSGVGVLVDRANWMAQAEYVTRHSAHAPEAIDAQGWYVLGGWRFGSLLPYTGFAQARNRSGGGPAVSAPQRTTTAGLRWDFRQDLALKAQVDRVDAMGGYGLSFVLPTSALGGSAGLTRPVNVVALALDFLF